MDSTIRGLFQTYGQKRGCTLFESADLKVHAKVVCHEIRCPNLEGDERTCASFEVMNRHDGQFYAEVGEIVDLHSLEVESVIFIRIHASQPGTHVKRACGEVRIPMRKLISQHDGMLYHCWLALECPGLADTVASVGLLGPNTMTDSDSFDQALHNGPRQVSQTQACITICRADDLAPDGSAVWIKDGPRAQCISHWGPLLRSQRQHVLLCAAQQLAQGAIQIKEKGGQSERQIASLQSKSKENANELESLRAKLKTRNKVLQDQKSGHPPRFGGESVSKEEPHGRLDMEITREEEMTEELKRIHDELEDELNKIGDEANAKISSANVRILSLRDERVQVAENVEQLTHANRMLRNEKDELISRKAALADEKEALMKVLEDLHQACNSAGFSMAGTQAINAFTGG